MQNFNIIFFFTFVHGSLYSDGGVLFKKIINESVRIVYTKLYNPFSRCMHTLRANALVTGFAVVGGTCAATLYYTGTISSVYNSFYTSTAEIISSKKEVIEKDLADSTSKVLKEGFKKAVDETLQPLKDWAKDFSGKLGDSDDINRH